MNKVHPLLRVGGPILGFILIWWIIGGAVGAFQMDMEAERKARIAAAEMAGPAEGEAVSEESQMEADAGETEADDASAMESDSEAQSDESMETEAEEEPLSEAEAETVIEAEAEDEPVEESSVEEAQEAAAAEEVEEGAGETADENMEATTQEAEGEEAAESEEAASAESEADQVTSETSADDTSADDTAAEGEADAPVDTELAFTAMIQSGCGGCHVIPGVAGAVGIVGPDLSNIGDPDSVPLEGYSVDEYIRESILMPNAYIAEECPNGPCLPNIMLQTLADTLSPEELDAIVGYLSTLEEGG